jgi:hypothetical protein
MPATTSRPLTFITYQQKETFDDAEKKDLRKISSFAEETFKVCPSNWLEFIREKSSYSTLVNIPIIIS